ncbi:lysophospholipid acyltransferase family protein [Oceaniglobus roseus]|uniref:lysophospholipid acyltransferase family protein n=1 Tax=Oceaniglobus roseus TaxID=1737570 RepID=UPI000C7F0E8E|nr:lysophospholipid acyltransferase family protein [Kandeliimicrobium roseum]
MGYALQWLRSLAFNIAMYAVMPVIGLIHLPWAIASPKGARAACLSYCHTVRWLASWMIGLKTEVRGTPPDFPCLIAAKHQSFLDILMIFSSVPRGRFIMKDELRYAPILGWFALRIGCIPVKRGERGKAVAKMKRDVEKGRDEPGQLIIYSQGTRTAPGSKLPYKAGTAALYQQLGQPCVPAACNVGVFWGRRGVYRKPGTAVVEFLPPIPPGQSRETFMARLQTEVEQASDALMAEAGFFLEKP